MEVSAFTIPWSRITRVFGSKDKGLVRTVLQNQRLAARAYYPDEDEKGEEPPTYQEALQAIVDGGPFKKAFPEVYVSAVGLLCASLGERLETLQLADEDVPLLSEAETALQKCGVADRLSIAVLLRRGAPFDIPQPEGLPALGYLTGPDVEAALQCYRSLDLSGVQPSVKAIIDQFGTWLNAAAEAHESLICLYE